MSHANSNNVQVLSWTHHDPRDSVVFNAWGLMYQFKTETAANGQITTTLWRTIRANREDRVGKLEWGANGSLGRAIVGKNTTPMSDMCRLQGQGNFVRSFNGPDGYTYTWRPQPSSYDTLLQDSNGVTIAFFRPIRPSRCAYGDVYCELHFLGSAGNGTVTHPPMMDMVLITSMIYRYVTAHNL
ncbi:hypothetical protein SISNIDRAFT_187983 [Sistotremastrum niveocremeum HHB9708]|uniref:DUF6593 domain-containing protein n=2 Tax=Sistotremastraceae TaxID=3402574 RepID=A0A164Z3F5_9AGAM|nr:hypothetical protein SISNIDRAFT_187983 [Sistotremastrum niveocremeum HHB9708]KZT38965.1 hypothetical protein SISSUDRAFT_702511 [Sistotremastrum suecicum HHB10207 ss-3]